MKNLMVFFMAFMLLGIGVYEAYRQKRKTRVLEEILRFVSLIKSEINYRATDMENLLKTAQKQNYYYICFDNSQVKIHDCCDAKVKNEFVNFLSRIGTTDTWGQIALCDEFLTLFSELLDERKQNEKSKIQVNTALSVLSALCVIIFSL